MINRFNLRTYGILIKNNKVLLSMESYQKNNLIKFPGGGVEYGEGIKEALIREWAEEVYQSIQIKGLFYVTDYFIQSAFIEEDQIVSFYYVVEADQEINESVAEHRLTWMELNKIHTEKLTFPQDKVVFELLCK